MDLMQPNRHRIRMDLAGRIRNTQVAAHDAFLPLFEAVVNSIHSTEDRFGDNVAQLGRVDIRIKRVGQQPLAGIGRPPIEVIESITIIDNGLGFTDTNLTSFETADSTAKLEKGGKGIGRLTWLVVFSRAFVESTFSNAYGALRRRSFTFSPTTTGITDFEEQDATGEVETSVTLDGLKRQYLEALRRRPETIADRVFEHCFNYFILGRCPRVTLTDIGDQDSVHVVINDRHSGLEIGDQETFQVGDHELQVRHIRQHYLAGRKHAAHLLANDRVVSSFPLADVADLGTGPIRSMMGELQVHHVYVSGAVLDTAADSTRTHFVLPDGEELIEGTGLLDLATLRTAIAEHVKERLADVLKGAREENLRRLGTYIRTQQPEYARLLDQRPEQLSRIRWSADPRLLDEAIYREKQAWELEIRQRQSKVEEELIAEKTDLEDVFDELYRVVKETNQAGQDDLVRYVVKRRAVLRLLGNLVKRAAGTLEEHIHELVFPLRRTNGEVDYDEHNLWLVDDNLAFYDFIASDLSMKRNSVAPSDSIRRPDVLAFKTGDPYQHISLIEFKKPDRDDENPVAQLVKYGQLLRIGGKMAADGATLPGIDRSIRIDAYAVVTLTPEMDRLLEMSPGQMLKVEGGGEWRWYGTHERLNMTIEVMDFRTFIRRAENRNRAFFKALGLSP